MQTKRFKDAFSPDIAQKLRYDNAKYSSAAVDADITDRARTTGDIELMKLIQRGEADAE